MKRPLLPVLACYILGAVFGRYFPGGGLLAAAMVSAGCAAAFAVYKKPAAALIPLAALAGFFLVSLSLGVKDAGLEAAVKAKSAVMAEGTVVSLRGSGPGYETAVVRDDGSGLRIYLFDRNKTGLRPGDRISFEAVFEALDPPRNPGGFNEFQYYRSRKVQYKARPAEIEVTGRRFVPEMLFLGARERAAREIGKVLPENQAGILTALITGDRSGIDFEDAELYRGVGIYHILAVSGLHVSILALITERLLSLFLRKRARAAASVLLMVLYCVFTGAGVATVRAVIMFSAASLGKVFRRDGDGINALALAALILLVYEPLYLWDMGFQYSFAAVACLMLLTPGLSLMFGRLLAGRRFFGAKFLDKYLAAIVAAGAGTYPITAFYYGTVFPASLPANLLLVPLVAPLILLGLAIILCGLFGLGISAVFGLGAGLILYVIDFAGRVLSALPFSQVITGSPHPAVVFVIYVLLGLFAYTMKAPKERFRAFALTSAAALALCLAPGLVSDDSLRVTMLDVGQGDGTVCELKGETIIIDGGGNQNALGQNTGARYLIPYLRHRGISRVGSVFVSHCDADHAMGVLELLSAFKVDSLYLGDGASGGLYNELVAEAQKRGVRVVAVSAGDEFAVKGALVSILSPEAGAGADTNEDSVVMKLSYGLTDFLFTGDISARTEAALIRLYPNELECDVLKLAHHGSKYSSSAAFLDAVSPQAAFAGAGRNNTYGHPAAETLSRLDERGIMFFTTAENGAVIFTANGSDITIRTMIK